MKSIPPCGLISVEPNPEKRYRNDWFPHRAKVVKNKIAPPFREAEFHIMYGQGISHTGEILDSGGQVDIIEKVALGLITGKPVWDKAGRCKDFLAKEENAAILQEIEEKIKANVKKLFEKAPKAAKGKVGKPVEQAAEDAEKAEESVVVQREKHRKLLQKRS